jgi:DNA-binding GntR family transcriptional regulator
VSDTYADRRHCVRPAQQSNRRMSDAYTPHILDYEVGARFEPDNPEWVAEQQAIYLANRKRDAERAAAAVVREREWAEQIAKEADVSADAASAVIKALEKHGWC